MSGGLSPAEREGTSASDRAIQALRASGSRVASQIFNIGFWVLSIASIAIVIAPYIYDTAVVLSSTYGRLERSKSYSLVPLTRVFRFSSTFDGSISPNASYAPSRSFDSSFSPAAYGPPLSQSSNFTTRVKLAAMDPSLASLQYDQLWYKFRDRVEPLSTNSSLLGCSNASWAGANDVNGSIALVLRGNCSFAQKTLVAQAAGATAVIVVNYQNEVFQMTYPADLANEQYSIPSIMVSSFTGWYLLQALLYGTAPYGVNTSVNASFETSVVPVLSNVEPQPLSYRRYAWNSSVLYQQLDGTTVQFAESFLGCTPAQHCADGSYISPNSTRTNLLGPPDADCFGFRQSSDEFVALGADNGVWQAPTSLKTFFDVSFHKAVYPRRIRVFETGVDQGHSETQGFPGTHMVRSIWAAADDNTNDTSTTSREWIKLWPISDSRPSHQIDRYACLWDHYEVPDPLEGGAVFPVRLDQRSFPTRLLRVEVFPREGDQDTILSQGGIDAIGLEGFLPAEPVAWSPTAAATCDVECEAHNGYCLNGKCVCDARGWGGSKCAAASSLNEYQGHTIIYCTLIIVVLCGLSISPGFAYMLAAAVFSGCGRWGTEQIKASYKSFTSTLHGGRKLREALQAERDAVLEQRRRARGSAAEVDDVLYDPWRADDSPQSTTSGDMKPGLLVCWFIQFQLEGRLVCELKYSCSVLQLVAHCTHMVFNRL